MEVHTGCYEIWLLEESNCGAPESSAQNCGRLREKLRLLGCSAGYFGSSRDCCAAQLETWCRIPTAVVLTHTQGILSYYINLRYSPKNRYIRTWHALFKSLDIYTYGQSGRRWYSSIIGGAPGHGHWEDLEMHHLEAIVMKRWTINTPPHLPRHPNRIHEKERFWFNQHRNRVRSYHTTWPWGSTDSPSEIKSWER